MKEKLSATFIVFFMTMLLFPVAVMNKPIEVEKFDYCFESTIQPQVDLKKDTVAHEVIAGGKSKSFNDNLDKKLELKAEKTLSDKEEYQVMPNKNIENNYTLVNNAINETTEIFYAGEPNDNTKKFLYEIAVVESRLGYLTTRYTTGGRKGKGVWQMERNAFNATKDIKKYPQLKPYLEKLKNETGIDWVKDVKWEHCNYVYYGAVAAHLYLVVNDIEAKDTTAKRAAQWKRHYNTYKGKGRTSDYIRKVERQNSMVGVNI